jgi:UMF1 family MFS transporter
MLPPPSGPRTHFSTAPRASSRDTAAAMTGAAAPVHEPPPSRPRLRAAAWVLYDLANTVYAATLTYLLTPYAKETLGDLRAFGLVSFASMVVAAVLVPVLGAVADQTARAGRYLALATIACIAAIAGLGADGGGALLLACFFAANVTYNLGLVFYNMLLPSVAAPGREGRLSGLGTGVGYLGTLALLLGVMPMFERPGERFPAAAVLFLVVALPCLLLVRDHRPPRAGPMAPAVRAALADLRATLRELPRQPALAWFLLGNFCLLDVINTAILYFADFTRTVFATAAEAGTLPFGDGRDLDLLIMVLGAVLQVLALVAGITQGRWTDRAPLAVMRWSALALLVALVGGAAFGGVSVLGYGITLVGCGAFGLAGVQTAGRKVVILLAPPERVGSYFGLYGVTVKLSVIGSAVYGFVEHAAGAKPAMLAQGVQLLLGLLCLAMVRVPAATTPASPAR